MNLLYVGGLDERTGRLVRFVNLGVCSDRTGLHKGEELDTATGELIRTGLGIELVEFTDEEEELRECFLGLNLGTLLSMYAIAIVDCSEKFKDIA